MLITLVVWDKMSWELFGHVSRIPYLCRVGGRYALCWRYLPV